MNIRDHWKLHSETCADRGESPFIVLSLSGFEPWFHRAATSSMAIMWGYTGGINSTFQFPASSWSNGKGDAVAAMFLDEDHGGGNWEGIEWVSKHGVRRARLLVTLMNNEKSGGIVSFSSMGEDPLTERAFPIMTWPFRPVEDPGSFDFRERGVRFTGPRGSSVTIFFTGEHENALPTPQEMHEESDERPAAVLAQP
jgi:hypothetical protein